MDEDFLSGLNTTQREAVEYIDGPSLVIAGAGSGKTRVLTYKIAYLLKNHVEPWRILALTFTNKAAREMKDRIGALVGTETAQQLQMGTFHSVFSHILRREAQHIGFNANYTIYDQADSRSLVKTIVKEMQLDDKKYKPATVQSRISMAKNHLISPAEYAEDGSAAERDMEQKLPEISRIYTAYNNRLHKANAMDFDDLLVYTYKLFRDHPDVRARYADRYAFVLVDEYQDTNSAQQKIVWQLTQEKQKVCVVGDDAQSIYGFRGANIDNILEFQNLYTSARLFKLERNYRSTQFIVQAANSLIKRNVRQIQKNLYSENGEGDKLQVLPAYSDKEEAQIVCNNILRLKKEEICGYKDFAVLYRTNAQSRSFEETFRKQNIPYRIYGGLSFFQRKEIKDVIAYFRLVANPNDEEAFRRIINYPTRGIGNTTLQKIIDAAGAEASLWDVIVDPVAHGLILKGAAWNKIQGFREMISAFIARAENTDVFTLGRDIVKESGIYKELYSDSSPEGQARRENLEEFLNGIQDFVENRKEEDRGDNIYINDYLQEVSLLSDAESENVDGDDCVALMTVHSAKGLEFPTVFVVGMEENIFPSQMSVENPRGLEEERRLLYVAITRAERHCIMTYAQNRFRYGHMECDSPSRFLNDIDSQFLNMRKYGSLGGGSTSRSSGYGMNGWGSRYQNSQPVASQFKADPRPKETRPQRPAAPVDPFSDSFKRKLAEGGANLRKIDSAKNVGTGKLSVGNVIEHQRFGVGKVIAVDGNGENTKATVVFQNAGTKQLLLKFARYNIVE